MIRLSDEEEQYSKYIPLVKISKTWNLSVEVNSNNAYTEKCT